MNVSLPPRLEAMVRKKLRKGGYSSASEVVREALRLLEERDRLRSIRMQELRKQIASGIEQADSGEVSLLDIQALKAEGRRRRDGGR